MKKIIYATIAAVLAISVIAIAFSAIPTHAEEEHEEEAHLQVTQDIGNRVYKQGQFLLLADFGHHHVEESHVAIVQDCDNNGNGNLDLAYGSVLKDSEGETNLTIVELNRDNIVQDLSTLGQLCTYHVGVEPSEQVPVITDIAVINKDSKKVKLSELAIATIHADIEIDEHEEE